MSYKSREKKRKSKIAKKNLEVGRHKMGGASREWWLAPVKQTTCCARHGGILRAGMDMVYRHTPREALCVACATADPAIHYGVSRAWELARGKKPKRKYVPSPERAEQIRMERELDRRVGDDTLDGAL